MSNKKISFTPMVAVRFFSRSGMGNTFYFGSIAAIFDMFTEAEVGISLRQLWAAQVTMDHTVRTLKCEIKKLPLWHKRQTSKNEKL